MNLLPCPRSVRILPGSFPSPGRGLPAAVRITQDSSSPDSPEGYRLSIAPDGIRISFREAAGLRAAQATLRQLVRQCGRHLPCLEILDWPDFPRRGVMLDVSRGRVPRLDTLIELAGRLADFKINELQLYTEHTFAYRHYQSVWRSWGALTGAEIRKLDARCRELGIDLVPNQNSFGHLRQFLEDPKLRRLAEVAGPYEDAGGAFVRRPSTLAPAHPGTLRFLRGIYNELLPNFSSSYFNVGCDETWDLGRGQSMKLCQRRGQGRVYLEFLRKIHREVSTRGRRMMFWGDIILKYPDLIAQLPAGMIALNWGYEADHPFEKEAAKFARAGIPFYICPGTSTWQTLIGRHDNALANLRAAARAGKKFGAAGYLVTDWGDGGHPQPLAVSWPMLAAGAALAWNADGFDQRRLEAILGRDVFEDPSGKIAAAAFRLGFVHRKLGVRAPNETPLGTVIAAPPPEERELFCRNGLKWFSKIPPQKIRAALNEIEQHRRRLRQAKAASRAGRLLARELDLAARMAQASCKFMLWQQAVAAGNMSLAGRMARINARELRRLERDFNSYWTLRNKATPQHCSAFLRWRIADYRKGAASASKPPARHPHTH